MSSKTATKIPSYGKSLGIPRKFKLFADTVEVEWVSNEEHMGIDVMGDFNPDLMKIRIASTCKGIPATDDKIKDVFFHEKVHALMYVMSKFDLYKDEVFIDILARLLRQADETSEYK